MTEDIERFDPDLLRTICSDALQGKGVPVSGASYLADALVETDLRGIASHGVTRMVPYLDALDTGAFHATATVTVDRCHGAVAQLDAHAGLGHLAARDAMDLAIELSGEHGVGIVTVRNSNHFGAAFLYPLRAVEQGRIGFITTNGPPVMPAYGGRHPAICNNPLAWGIPTREAPPIVLDMACMVAARGKITLAAREGRSIPVGWALDSEGEPTTDPLVALNGILQPMGGAKGYGLAVINEVLGGALAGAQTLNNVPDTVIRNGRYTEPMEIGHFVMALDPEAFGGLDQFTQAVEDVRVQLKSGDPAPGFEEILLPGEPEFLRRQERLVRGIPLEASTVAALRDIDGQDRLVPVPWR